MGYFVTGYESIVELRDCPNSPDQTQRTFAVRGLKADAVETALALLDVRAEVTICFEDEGGGRQILRDWAPAQCAILSNPKPIGTDRAVMSWFSHALVDRHHYEYTAGDGRKRQFAFETGQGELPQVPQFGTQAAIDRLRLQLKRQDCRAVAPYFLKSDSGVVGAGILNNSIHL